MPLYHFHIWRGSKVMLDVRGMELPGDEQARRYGLGECHDLAQQDLPGDLKQWRVEIVRHDKPGSLDVLHLPECDPQHQQPGDNHSLSPGE